MALLLHFPYRRGAKDDEGEDDADELLAKVNEDTRKINPYVVFNLIQLAVRVCCAFP